MFLSGSHVHTAQTSWSKMATASLAQHPMITMIWVIPNQNQLHLIRKCIFALFMVRIPAVGRLHSSLGLDRNIDDFARFHFYRLRVPLQKWPNISGHRSGKGTTSRITFQTINDLKRHYRWPDRTERCPGPELGNNSSHMLSPPTANYQVLRHSFEKIPLDEVAPSTVDRDP